MTQKKRMPHLLIFLPGIMGSRLQKDGKDIAGNDSAKTSTLALQKVQLSDTGSYAAVASNSGGSGRLSR